MIDKKMFTMLRDFIYIARQSNKEQLKQAIIELQRLQAEGERKTEWGEEETRDFANRLADIIEQLEPERKSE